MEIYNLTDLFRVDINLDLSKYLVSKEDKSVYQILEKINIGTLKKSNTEGFHAVIDELTSAIPRLELSGMYGDFRVVLRAFYDKKLRLGIRKGEKILEYSSFPKIKEEEKFPNKRKIEELSNSYNFLVAILIGSFQVKEKPSFKIRIGFKKEDSILPSNKLKIVENNLSAILDVQKISLTEIEIEISEKEGKHKLEFTQNKEQFYSHDEYTIVANGSPPIALWEILQNSLNRINDYVKKLR